MTTSTPTSASGNIFNTLITNNAAKLTPSSDIFNTLVNTANAVTPAKRNIAPYRPVDPKAYEGAWTGSYGNGQKFRLLISNVRGWRAQVRYESGSTVSYQSVLINSNSFRVGDTKFVLIGKGQAEVGTVVTDPRTGKNKLLSGGATQNA